MDRTAGEADPALRSGSVAPTLAAEVRATLLLFGMIVAVILGFALTSTLALRLLAS
ncbi:MAG: hypothetical protein JWM93_50 [Frankiales bacterium]|nr:hypothetical protein [Frankiales bacterium]